MEAPNKVYLAFDYGFVTQSSISKEDANGNSIFLSKYKPIEYIRKDALLEWAKESIDSLGRLSYGEFINKLNSM